MKRFVFSLIMVVMMASMALGACSPALAPTATPPPTQEGPTTAKPEWEQKWDQMVTTAKKEGKVVMYGEIGPMLRERLTQDFQNKYGVQMDFVIGRPPEVAQRYLQERAANLHLPDVFMAGQTTTLTILKPRGVLAPIKPHLILPEVLDPKVWPGGTLPFLDKDELALALLSAYRSGVVVNTELVKAGQVSSYEDLLNPQWKGKIILSDPSLPGAGATWFAFAILKAMGREEGEKYMRRLATQDLAMTRDHRLQAETVARGKYSIGIGILPQPVADLAKAGAPIAWAGMKEGGIILTGAFAVALPDQPPHPNAAALMVNHLLSKEGQLAVSEAAGEPARRLDVPTTYALAGTVAQPGDKVAWADEDFILTEPTLYPLAKEIFKIQ